MISGSVMLLTAEEIEAEMTETPQYFGSNSKLVNSRKNPTRNTVVFHGIQQSEDYAEIPYGSSIFSLCRLRSLHGGPWDYYDFSHLF